MQTQVNTLLRALFVSLCAIACTLITVSAHAQFGVQYKPPEKLVDIEEAEKATEGLKNDVVKVKVEGEKSDATTHHKRSAEYESPTSTHDER